MKGESLQPIEPNYGQIIRSSQQAWRGAGRGRLSRPTEIPSRISSSIDKGIKGAFRNYIDPDRPLTSIAWGVLIDQPHTPSDYRFDNRFPPEISADDHSDFATGIGALNEWVTNQATKHYIAYQLPKPLGEIYGALGDQIMGRVPYFRAYSAMGQVRGKAKNLGEDFDDAIFKACFNHQFEDLNSLILTAHPYGSSNLNELAVALGRNKTTASRAMRGLTKWLDHYVDDSSRRDLLGRTAASMLLAGYHRQPGVVEISMAMPAASALLVGSLQRLIYGMNPQETVTIAGTFFAVAALQAFGFPHELIHGYSASENYLGLIPVTLQIPDEVK